MHHIIGSAIGGIVTYLLLLLLIPGSVYNSQFLTAVVIGAIVAMIWPWFIAFMLARRVKNKRNAQIQSEVDKQISEQKPGG